MVGLAHCLIGVNVMAAACLEAMSLTRDANARTLIDVSPSQFGGEQGSKGAV